MNTQSPSTTADIKALALRYLSLREHSQKELMDKIQAKGFAKPLTETVVADLAEQGLQSDARYAECYARYRIRKGFGPLAINYGLKQNGIHHVDLNKILTDIADSWLDVLTDAYTKKYRPNLNDRDSQKISRKEWAKRCRFLLQRGFPADMLTALQEHLNITLTSI